MTASAKIVCDSVSPAGKRITSWLLNVPAIISEELVRHRALSFSVASTRAIPFKRQLEQVRTAPFVPYYWGTEQKGMEPGAQISGKPKDDALLEWQVAADCAADCAERIYKRGVHKSLCSRLLMPFLYKSILVTATEVDNLFALRCADDADPEIHKLAFMMYDAWRESVPTERTFHFPFLKFGEVRGFDDEAAMLASAMRCARLSYGHIDGRPSSLGDDAESARTKLLANYHMSPFEHPAVYQNGASSGNFEGWVQARQYLTGGRGLKALDPAAVERSRGRFS